MLYNNLTEYNIYNLLASRSVVR